ncbi:hypothetical protein C9J21_21155 [Photobacterium phosphoreum]|uniref:hypothetical protein n=1 Tax=Photobacterium phosphoreum TaxID=659 RepID=UPI000D16E1BD|nr:hypothetical protein [Photobacterium phosphoreum]PSW27704.1 hypothetical protein C9J21_21155 [Photobacterium phosphoreum]
MLQDVESIIVGHVIENGSGSMLVTESLSFIVIYELSDTVKILEALLLKGIYSIKELKLTHLLNGLEDGDTFALDEKATKCLNKYIHTDMLIVEPEQDSGLMIHSFNTINIFDEDDFEPEIKKQRKINKKILFEFENSMIHEGLSNKTITSHMSNVDFYINEYLQYYDAKSVLLGIDALDEFFMDWFPRKAMWNSQSHVKSNITSLKKFYNFMSSRGIVAPKDLNKLKLIIKENKENWLSRYN